MQPSLAVNNLHARVDTTPILKGVSLSLKPGTIHALMGPNGSGKSTLASVIAGHPGYAVTKGSISLGKKRVTPLTPDERAKLGVFLSFQYPVEVPGLSLEHFMRTAYNNTHPDETLSAIEFHKLFMQKLKELKMPSTFAERSLNEGFSGGEKKKAEILQMAILQPQFAILDETDSGLDIDALKAVARGVMKLQNPNLSILLITHYVRILRYIKPDYVHIMAHGQIVKSGRRELATQVERKGYDWLINPQTKKSKKK